jgi:hypothetical protein
MVLAAIAALFVVATVPASAAPAPPRPPGEGWVVGPGHLEFLNTNPCTGEAAALVIDRVRYSKPHTDGTTSRYYYNATFDGWSTHGWVHAWTLTRISPDGGFVRADQQQYFLYEDGGTGIVAVRDLQHIVILADGTEVVHNSPFIVEICCVKTGETWTP